MSEDARLAFARELERTDAEVAAVLEEVDELYERVESVRGRALELEAFLTIVPARREAAAAVVEERAVELAEAEATAAQAAAELAEAESSGDKQRLAAARRFEVRARDAASTATRRADEARAALDELDTQAADAGREAQELAGRAGELASALRERPRLAEAGAEPAPGLPGVSEWASGARAALLVARSSLAAERDAVVRQANELGALVLGEPLTASSAATVARQVERELGAR